ncbi:MULTISPECIES: hypothetical protein [Streptomyces]|uniref:Uncharacterized protein n=1 Tax=Streptomyces lichenis TaxID=2306967 RepID=A0ABT0I8V9_9ACTN|nr:hypothetical protein [Streptomyces lichenis]MCK8677760.1 hypothetical protein [Streptomyces lichenis]
MLKRVLAAAGLAAAVVGAAAPVAAAVGDGEVRTQNGNFSTQSYGNTGAAGNGHTAGRALGEGDLRALDGMRTR